MLLLLFSYYLLFPLEDKNSRVKYNVCQLNRKKKAIFALQIVVVAGCEPNYIFNIEIDIHFARNLIKIQNEMDELCGKYGKEGG